MKSSRHVWWRRAAVLLALVCPLVVFAGGDAKKEAKPEKKAKVRRVAKSAPAREKRVTITGSNLSYSARDASPARSHLFVTVIDRKALDRTGRPNLTDALILHPSLSRTGW
jgi:hypothetical protein